MHIEQHVPMRNPESEYCIVYHTTEMIVTLRKAYSRW